MARTCPPVIGIGPLIARGQGDTEAHSRRQGRLMDDVDGSTAPAAPAHNQGAAPWLRFGTDQTRMESSGRGPVARLRSEELPQVASLDAPIGKRLTENSDRVSYRARQWRFW